MKAKHLAGLLLLGLIWGASFLFIKISVLEILPITLVAVRLLIAAAVLVVVMYLRGLRFPRSMPLWGHQFVIGLVGVAVPFWLITWGELSIPSGMAAILLATSPLLTLILAYVTSRDERLAGLKLLGLALGFVGVVVAVGLDQLNLSSAGGLGRLAVIGAALCYAISALYVRHFFRGQPPLIPATGQLLTGAVLMTPMALLVEGVPHVMPSFLAIASLLALTVIGTAFAYILYYWLMEQIGATRTSMVSYLTPPLALFYGWLILNEPITISVVLGLVLVLVGIMLANGLLRFAKRQVL